MAHHDHVELCHRDCGLQLGDEREILTYVESSYLGGRVDIQRAHNAVGPAEADHWPAEAEHARTTRRARAAATRNTRKYCRCMHMYNCTCA